MDLLLISLNAILEIYKKIIINPPTYKINIINEIHDVLLIKLIIIVSEIDWHKIIIFAFKGDFTVIKLIAKIILVNKIILIRIQYIF